MVFVHTGFSRCSLIFGSYGNCVSVKILKGLDTQYCIKPFSRFLSVLTTIKQMLLCYSFIPCFLYLIFGNLDIVKQVFLMQPETIRTRNKQHIKFFKPDYIFSM